MASCGLLEVTLYMKEEWRSVWTTCGVPCVMTPGEVLMPLWCVDNWDTLVKVSKHTFKCLKKCFFMHLYVCSDAVAFSNAHFGAGTGPIHLDNVGCNGSEMNLLDCSRSSFGSCYSGHREDAGVRCQGTLVCLNGY